MSLPRKSLHFGYVKISRRHIKARNLNGSVVLTRAQAHELVSLPNSQFSLALSNTWELSSKHQQTTYYCQAAPHNSTFFRERKKRIYFTVRILHQKGHRLRENHCNRTSERCPSRSSWTPYHCQVKVSRQICLFKRWFLSTNVTSFETYFPWKRFHFFG